MKLYYMPGACSLAAHIVLEWIGQPYETQKLSREELKQPAFLAINPLGAVPALDDGGWTITQNAAILEYLAEQAPGKQLLGDGTARSRAEVRRWLGFVNAEVHKTFSLLFGAPRYVENEAAQQALRASAAKMLRGYYALADAHFAGRDYIAGALPSVADAYLYVTLRWAHAKEIDLQGLDNLARFYDRMRADPAVLRALEAEGLAP